MNTSKRSNSGYLVDLVIMTVGVSLAILALTAGPKAFGAEQAPVVNINTATPQQLAYLPGIGETLAERIVAYRTERGPFVRVADLRLVKGFGGDGKLLAKVSPYAMVSGPTTATGEIR